MKWYRIDSFIIQSACSVRLFRAFFLPVVYFSGRAVYAYHSLSSQNLFWLERLLTTMVFFWVSNQEELYLKKWIMLFYAKAVTDFQNLMAIWRHYGGQLMDGNVSGIFFGVKWKIKIVLKVKWISFFSVSNCDNLFSAWTRLLRLEAGVNFLCCLIFSVFYLAWQSVWCTKDPAQNSAKIG